MTEGIPSLAHQLSSTDRFAHCTWHSHWHHFPWHCDRHSSWHSCLESTHLGQKIFLCQEKHQVMATSDVDWVKYPNSHSIRNRFHKNVQAMTAQNAHRAGCPHSQQNLGDVYIPPVQAMAAKNQNWAGCPNYHQKQVKHCASVQAMAASNGTQLTIKIFAATSSWFQQWLWQP